ncbi:hypothetical protein EVG20_g10554 [Dentipellis fragilis]|uniref:Uncharacterized protein n=1 Tax=Dentipellis fragilis TaxID=205917 RepID=A0A4Y9XQQ8_9AGAM|nr:hypothetical protein EVG20_g10554 [Dentipellis fragilis]
MSYLNQLHVPPPFGIEHPELAQQITLTAEDVVFLREHGLHLNTQDDVGSFEFADLMHSDHVPQNSEPFTLTHRPEEDIYRVRPQVQSTDLYGHQSTYNTEGYQNNSFFVPAHAATSVPSMPIQTQQESAPYGDAYSIPRAAWPPSSGSGYAVTAPAPSATLNHSDMAGAQDFTLSPVLTSSSSASYQEPYYESLTSWDAIPSYASYSGPNHAAPASWDAIGSPPLPEVTPMLPDPRTMPSIEQLLAHQRSMPGYDGTGAQYGSGAGYVPAETFGPIQYQNPGQTSASLRQAVSRVKSRRQTRERVAPIVSRIARSGQQGNQTLKNNNNRTRTIDLGDEYITGQSSQGCLLVPSRGPMIPAPAPSAGVSTGTAKVGRAAKAKTSRKRRDLAMPLPHRMPPAAASPALDVTTQNATTGGMSTIGRGGGARDVTVCIRTRSDNAGRHYRKIHVDDKKKAKEDIVQVNGDATEDT